MNIEKIKETIEENKGKSIKFRFNGSRNQTEEFTAVIENAYNYVFIVRLQESNDQLKSFTYSDILTQSLQIFME
jgi:Uncharacterized protein conserved in bacteria